MQLDSNAFVEVDGVSDDESVFVEVFAHQGNMKGGQRDKVATDALKLITLGQSRPDAKLILALAHPDVIRFATKGTWVAAALKAWRVEVLEVELHETTRGQPPSRETKCRPRARQTPAMDGGCRTNRSENRAVNWSRDNSGEIGCERMNQWDKVTKRGEISPLRPTGARAAIFRALRDSLRPLR